MTFKSFVYKALKASNDVNAIQKSLKHSSSKPIAKRVKRRVLGKILGRLFR